MKKMGLFWFAAALLGAALIFAGCESPTSGSNGAAGAPGTVVVTSDLTDAALQTLVDSGSPILIAAASTISGSYVDLKTAKITVLAALEVDTGLVFNAINADVNIEGGGSVTNNGTILIPSTEPAWIEDVGGNVAAAVGSEADIPAVGSITAVKDLTLEAGKTPAWYGYNLAIYVYGTLTVKGSPTVPSPPSVVAIGEVLIDGSVAAVTTLSDADRVDVSNATITLNENKTVKVTLPDDLSGPTFKVTGEQGLLQVDGTTAIDAHVTNNNGYVEFTDAVTKAVITGRGSRVRFSGEAAFATNASTITAGLVEFTNTTAPSFEITGNSITAEKITFTKGLTLSAPLALNGDVYIGTITAITFSDDDGTLTLGAGSTINVGTAQLLSANSAVVLTAAADDAVLTATAAVTTSGSEAPAKLALSAEALELTSGKLTVATGSLLSLGEDFTVAAGAELVANGTVNVAATKKLILATTSAAAGKISGAGNIVAGATTITGAWEAVGTNTGTLTITSATTGATITAATAATSLKASAAGATITQAEGTSNNLVIEAATSIDLTNAGTIILKKAASNGGKISLKDTTGKITGLKGGTSNVTLVAANIANATLTVGTAAGNVAGGGTQGAGNAWIGGGLASSTGTITAADNAPADASISSTTLIGADT